MAANLPPGAGAPMPPVSPMDMLGAMLPGPGNPQDVTPVGLVQVVEKPLKDVLRYDTEEHNDLLRRLKELRDMSYDVMRERHVDWDAVDNHMRMRLDLSEGQRLGDGTRDYAKKEMPFRRGIVVPLTLAMLEVRRTQGLSMLLSRDPEIQIAPVGGEDVKGAAYMEATLAYDARAMGWPLVLNQHLYDVDRYGLAVMTDWWEREHSQMLTPPILMPGQYPPEIEAIIRTWAPGVFEPGREWKLQREYNRVVPVDPRQFFPDPRFSIQRLQEGEFVGHCRQSAWVSLKEMDWDLGGPYFNLDSVREHCGRTMWDSSLGRRVPRKDLSANADPQVFDVYSFQVRIIPSEWGLGSSDRPERWWFAWVDDEVLIRAHPLGYGHDKFMYSAAQAIPDWHRPDALGWGELLQGLQLTSNWLVSSHIQARRRALNGALLYSPDLIEEEDLLHPVPGGHVRLTKRALELIMQGRITPAQLYHSMATNDFTERNLNDVGYINDLAQRMTGANDPIQGIPMPDKRTLGEVQAVLANAGQRIQGHVRLVDRQAIQATVERMMANRQQWTSRAQRYRITGQLAVELEKMASAVAFDRAPGGGLSAMIRPEDLWGNFDYVSRSADQNPDPGRGPEALMKMLELFAQFGGAISDPMLYPDNRVPNIRATINEILRQSGIKNVDEFWMNRMPPPMPGAGMMGPGGQPATVVPDEMYAQQVQAGNFVTPQEAMG